MAFELNAYTTGVKAILSLAENGAKPMPLANGTLIPAGVEAIQASSAPELFPNALNANAALAGLYLYFCDYDNAHTIAQDIHTPEGSFWHGILHRQEPDPGNAGYWFRRVGKHPVFPALRDAASNAGYKARGDWDPFAFIDYCEQARRKPGSKDEELAMTVQLAEWQLLFDYCARPQL
jgi:hypothetical protein